MAKALHRLANPARFLRIASPLLPWIAAGAAVCMGLGLWFGLVESPPDYQQGDAARIMYVHVPAAWNALAGYAGLAIASAIALVWRHPLALVAARCIAPIGACFTVIAIATGSIWGHPMWGTWWVWDARLTSVVVLLFLYLGYIALLHAFDEQETGERAATVLALIGAVNLPVIKFSVDWWNTLHQPASILRFGGPSIDPAMLLPLMLMAGGFTLLFAYLVIIRMQTELTRRRVMALRRTALAMSPASDA